MKKSSRLTGLFLSLLGTFVLLSVIDKPRVEALHGSDILRLLAAGAGLGLGIAGLFGLLRFPNE